VNSDLSGIVLIGADTLVGELGGDLAALKAEAGLPAATFDDPDATIPAEAALRFFELAAERLDCADFGLRLAQRQDLAVLGPLYLMMLTTATVGDALQMLAQYLRLHSSSLVVGITRNREGALIDYAISFSHRHDDRQVIELGVALVTAFVRSWAGPDWMPPYAQFRHSAPPSLALHRRVFGEEIAFEQERNAVCVDAAALRIPLQSPGAEARKLAIRMIRRRDALDGGALMPRAEAAIRARIAYGQPCSVEAIAGALGYSVRSLQRGLAAAGSGFEDMRDAVRADLARKYLLQSHVSLAEIADMLGYAQPSALTRAFRRWHGVSPLRYRRDAGR